MLDQIILATALPIRYLLKMPADESVTHILETAFESVLSANIPDDLKQIAFEKAFEFLARQGSASSLPLGDIAVVPTPLGGPKGIPIGIPDKSLEKIAQKLNIELDLVEHAFHVSDGELFLNLPSSDVPSIMSEGTKLIALLVVVGRITGGWDADWTSINEIKKACESYRVLDIDHFARHMKAIDMLLFSHGERNEKKLKPRKTGIEKAASEIKRLGERT